MTIEITNTGKTLGGAFNLSVKDSISGMELIGNVVPDISTRKRVVTKFIIREYSDSLLEPTGHVTGDTDMYRYVQELSDGDISVIGSMYGEDVQATATGHCIAIAKVTLEDTTDDLMDGTTEVV